VGFGVLVGEVSDGNFARGVDESAAFLDEIID
jgi:hypothetical protein